MSSPCKRMRLETDNDDDDDDQVVVAAVKNDDNTSTKNVEFKTEKAVSATAANNGAYDSTTSLIPEQKTEAIDLTVDYRLPGDTRRNFSHTAEVIKARYIKAMQQFQRISSLIDAIAAQQAKLESRREHLQGLMNALTTMYKVVKGQHRPPRTPAAPLIYTTEAPCSTPLTAADSQVTSSTSTEYLSADDVEGWRDSIQDLTLADEKAAGARWDVEGKVDCGPRDAKLVAAHTSCNRVDISSSSFDCPPPAHTTRVDMSGCTYIVHNSCDVVATDD